MVTATVVFAATLVTHVNGYEGGEVHTLPLVLGLVGDGLLLAGRVPG